MPVTSVTRDPDELTLTIVADFPVPQQRLWDAWADPRQLERFWGPPFAPATFTHHDFTVGGRAEYFLTGPNGEKWSGSWKFTAVDTRRDAPTRRAAGRRGAHAEEQLT